MRNSGRMHSTNIINIRFRNPRILDRRATELFVHTVAHVNHRTRKRRIVIIIVIPNIAQSVSNDTGRHHPHIHIIMYTPKNRRARRGHCSSCRDGRKELEIPQTRFFLLVSIWPWGKHEKSNCFHVEYVTIYYTGLFST